MARFIVPIEPDSDSDEDTDDSAEQFAVEKETPNWNDYELEIYYYTDAWTPDNRLGTKKEHRNLTHLLDGGIVQRKDVTNEVIREAVRKWAEGQDVPLDQIAHVRVNESKRVRTVVGPANDREDLPPHKDLTDWRAEQLGENQSEGNENPAEDKPEQAPESA